MRKYPLGEVLCPKDPRSLLKTPRSTVVRDVHPGSYCHLGLRCGILDTLATEFSKYTFSEVLLQIGIDGLPLSESSNSQLWPILGTIYPSKKVFLIGAYHGQSKPSDSNEFLCEFVEELKMLIQSGITYNGFPFKVSMHSLICDALAKSFITKTKGHGGYFGCTKCIQEGKYLDRRVCFPEINCTKRTDGGFIAGIYEDLSFRKLYSYFYTKF